MGIYLKNFSMEEIAELTKLLRSEANTKNFRRVQCLYLRAKYQYSPAMIADITGFHVQTVRNIHSSFFKYGKESLFLKTPGGRLRENMSINEEKDFISKFTKLGDQGQILEISKFHSALEEHLGRKLPKATSYNLLHRHGWRKVVPRPYHPKRNNVSQDTFKKTSWIWSKVLL